jgi:hypothetical protein
MLFLENFLELQNTIESGDLQQEAIEGRMT